MSTEIVQKIDEKYLATASRPELVQGILDLLALVDEYAHREHEHLDRVAVLEKKLSSVVKKTLMFSPLLRNRNPRAPKRWWEKQEKKGKPSSRF